MFNRYAFIRMCTRFFFDPASYFFENVTLPVLRCCATNRKVTGSIPTGVSGFFIDIKSFRLHYDLGVDLASNRNEYQEYCLGVKVAGA